MGKFETITAEVDEATLALVESIARDRGITVEAYAEEAIRRVVGHERALRTMLDEADGQIDRGEYHTQDQVEAWFADQAVDRAAE